METYLIIPGGGRRKVRQDEPHHPSQDGTERYFVRLDAPSDRLLLHEGALGSIHCDQTAGAMAGTCAQDDWASILLSRDRDNQARITVLRGRSCQHLTSVEFDQSCLARPIGFPLPTATLNDIKSLAMDVVGELNPFTDWQSIGGRIDRRIAGIAAITLAESPFASAIAFEDAIQRVDKRLLAELLQTRSTISQLAITATANTVGPLVARELTTAGMRIDSDLASVTAIQSLQLQELTQTMNENEKKRDEQEKRRDWNLARLGSATLFPMVVLSFMGTNVLPPSWTAAPYLIGTVIASAVAGYLGHRWITRMNRNVEDAS